MCEKENGTLTPVRKHRGDRDGPYSNDLKSGYREMVACLKHDPLAIKSYNHVFEEIFKPYAENHGELLVSKSGNEERAYFVHEGIPITDFGVVPLSIIQKCDVAQIRYFVELLILGQDIPPREVVVDCAKLGSSQWIDDLGPGYIYERKGLGHLKILIQVMAKYAPVKHEYLYSGWQSDSDSIYILEGVQLRGKDWSVDRARVSCEHTLQMLDVAQHMLTIPLLSIELLSLVHSRMMCRGEYFKGVCCIVAPTQSFKTTLASLFFDYENGREADINFEATMAAIVRTVGNIRDSTVVIDDYKPGATKAESNEMLLKISKIIRMCSDDSGGIKKAGAQNSTITNTAHCMAVITAEQVQLNVQSTLARLLILEVNRKDVDRDRLTYFQANHSKYQGFIKDFISYICMQGVDTYCDKLAQRFLEERNFMRNQLSEKSVLVDNRTNDMCVWLYVSFSEFLKYAFDSQTINKEQFDERMEEAQTIFQTIMRNQAERVSDLDETKRFFRGLQVLIETKEAFIGELQSRNTSYATKNSKEAIGFSKKGYVYLKNEVAFREVVSYYRRYGKEFSISEATLRKLFADSGYINPKNDKTYIHRLFINHETYQCVRFDESKFYELLRGGQKDGSEGDREIPGDWGVRQNADNIFGRRN